MKIVLTGGGTGGHVIPNIAIIDYLKVNYPKAELVYIGSKKGMEKGLIAEKNCKFYAVETGKLRRYFSWENFIDLIRIPAGLIQSLFIIKKFKPQVIFAKGGYVSFPVVIAGFILRIPIILHESDLVPGMANKLLSKFADKICISYKESLNYFKNKDKIILTGNPVRIEITKGKKEVGYKLTHFNKEKPILLVMGGSSGAAFINGIIEKNKQELLKKYQIIHICGKGKEIEIKNKNYLSFQYVNEELKDLYAISDLIISRAGANSLAEIAILNKSAIIIPLSRKASRGDQIFNAESFVKNHHAELLLEEDYSDEKVLTLIDKLIKNKTKESEGKSSYDLATKQISEIILNYENRN